ACAEATASRRSVCISPRLRSRFDRPSPEPNRTTARRSTRNGVAGGRGRQGKRVTASRGRGTDSAGGGDRGKRRGGGRGGRAQDPWGGVRGTAAPRPGLGSGDKPPFFF